MVGQYISPQMLLVNYTIRRVVVFVFQKFELMVKLREKIIIII